MAFFVIEIDSNQLTIQDINDKCQNTGNKQDAVNGAVNILMALACGAKNGTVKLVSKDIATTISTSGTGSNSTTY